jgi:hypothetical protein
LGSPAQGDSIGSARTTGGAVFFLGLQPTEKGRPRRQRVSVGPRQNPGEQPRHPLPKFQKHVRPDVDKALTQLANGIMTLQNHSGIEVQFVLALGAEDA